MTDPIADLAQTLRGIEDALDYNHVLGALTEIRDNIQYLTHAVGELTGELNSPPPATGANGGPVPLTGYLCEIAEQLTGLRSDLANQLGGIVDGFAETLAREFDMRQQPPVDMPCQVPTWAIVTEPSRIIKLSEVRPEGPPKDLPEFDAVPVHGWRHNGLLDQHQPLVIQDGALHARSCYVVAGQVTASDVASAIVAKVDRLIAHELHPQMLLARHGITLDGDGWHAPKGWRDNDQNVRAVERVERLEAFKADPMSAPMSERLRRLVGVDGAADDAGRASGTGI